MIGRSMININDILNKFEEIENDLQLCSRSNNIDDVPWWDIVRYKYYRIIVNQCLTNDSRSLFGGNLKRIKKIGSILHSILFMSPRSANKSEVVFIGHPRRRLENGVFVDIYVDPLLRILDGSISYCVLEEYYGGGHSKPAKTSKEHLFYLDGLQVYSMAKIFLYGNRYRQETVSKVKEIQERFNCEFDVNIDLIKLALDAVNKWKSELPLYENLLRRIDPKALFVVVSAGHETIISAAKKLNIETFELQHGSPSPGKLNYDYSSGCTKTSFPDWFLAYGEFWINDILPISHHNIIDFGYPYLNHATEKYNNVIKKNQVLIIPQPGISENIINFTHRLIHEIHDGIQILYKVHPSEVDFDGLKELSDAGVIIEYDGSNDFHLLMAESKWVIGVYSTMLYESVAFGCHCYVLNVRGCEYMKNFIDYGYAQLVDDVYDIDFMADIDYSVVDMNIFSTVTKCKFEKIMNMVDAVK
jgi:hypothetical protein